MYKILVVISCLCLSQFAYADDDVPLDPVYEARHGMVIVNKGSNLYASNLATYSAPHNAQILYKLEIREVSLIQLVRDADLVTMFTKPFNLQRLMRGENVTVEADVYLGHYNRSGMQVFSNLPVTFKKHLYARLLDELESKDKKQKYDAVEVGTDEYILIHQIQTPPSYDHLVLVTNYVSCIKEFDTGSDVPTENELTRKLMYCGPLKPLYFESEVFKKQGG
jgi:hypothetical protein